MTKKQLRINDVSLTDGQSAVWGGAMTSAMRLSVGHELEGANLSAIEVLSSETITQCIARDENPWQYLELLRYQNQRLPFRANINLLTEHGRAGADVVAADVIEKLVAQLARRDVSQIVFVEPHMRLELIEPALKAASSNGVTAIAALLYFGDSELSEDDYAAQAVQLARAGAARVMLRDEAGLLTADIMRTLIPKIFDALEETPLGLHTRCTTGLGPMVAGEAVKLGIRELDTALPALANGGSAPSSLNLLDSMASVGIELEGVNQEVLATANKVLGDIAGSEDFAAAIPWGFELAPYVHQLPGNVASWAVNKLRGEGNWNLLNEFSHECVRVREDIGSPPMLSPFARGVAEQALLNLNAERRYSELRPIVRRSLQGVYGPARTPVNAALLDWVGAVGATSPSSWDELCTANPSASDEQRITVAVSGRSVEDQPRPAKMNQLIYKAKTPAQLLSEGLKQYVGSFGVVRVSGPGIDIQES